MAYRTRREGRYKKLRDVYFLRSEARPLSKIPTRVCPYLRALMRERRDLARRAIAQGKTIGQFEDQIKELYRVNRWLKRNRVGKIVADPWKMLRDYEDKFKAKNPQYTSPWEKRWKDWGEFQRRIERTIAKQRGAS